LFVPLKLVLKVSFILFLGVLTDESAQQCMIKSYLPNLFILFLFEILILKFFIFFFFNLISFNFYPLLERLSNESTLKFMSLRCSTRFEPIKPHPPVTKIFLINFMFNYFYLDKIL